MTSFVSMRAWTNKGFEYKALDVFDGSTQVDLVISSVCH